MSFVEIFLIALALAMDAFAVSIASGTNSNFKGNRAYLRLAFHLGWFQFLMPVIGWFTGSTFSSYISSFDHWIALVLLSYVGLKMIKSAFAKEENKGMKDPSKGKMLVLLSVATSIDALAIGFSIALLGIDIWYPAIIIGIVTGTLSFIGIKAGNFLGNKFGKIMEFFGGLILIAIGIKIFLEHFF